MPIRDRSRRDRVWDRHDRVHRAGPFPVRQAPVGGRGTVQVPTASLGGLIEKYGFETINLLCDIEGAEVAMVENEAEVLRSRVKNLIMETHEEYLGEGPIVKMLATLKELGFELRERSRETVVALTNPNL